MSTAALDRLFNDLLGFKTERLRKPKKDKEDKLEIEEVLTEEPEIETRKAKPKATMISLTEIARFQNDKKKRINKEPEVIRKKKKKKRR